MKKLLIIPMLFACYLCIGQTDSASIIGKSFRLGNLVVAQKDFPKQMLWEDAKKACEALGNGWRLPTKDEQKILYKNRENVGFTPIKANGDGWGVYWSSTEGDYSGEKWMIFIGEGIQQSWYKGSKTYVRAVRSL